MDGSGTTSESQTTRPPITPITSLCVSKHPLGRVEVTRISAKPFFRFKFNLYGCVNTGDAELRGEDGQGVAG